MVSESDASRRPPTRAHDHGDAMFPHVGRWSRGYDPDQVDHFFARARLAYEGHGGEPMGSHDVRSAAFPLARGGYTPAAVDEALDRLEAAFVATERAEFVARRGEAAWERKAQALARTLLERAERPPRERFAHARVGYAADEVDGLLERVVATIESEGDLTSLDVRAATFRAARGSRAYAEGPVDAYLDRAAAALQVIE